MSEPIIEGEVWKAIPGFEGRYSISNRGRVKSHLYRNGKSEQILKPYPTGTRGDLKVDLGGNPRRTILVAVLVAEAFLEPDFFRDEVNHIDGNFLNNRADNLEWSTHSENLIHSYRVLGRRSADLRGTKNGLAKLTDDLVREYRAMRASGMAIREITRLSGLDRRTIQKMLRGDNWSHVH